MFKTLNIFKSSFFELKNIKSLAAIAMLLALRIVLGIFANPTLALFGNSVKISFAFLPIAVAGAMFGPVPAALVGALGDVMSFVLAPSPGGYFPGFTISGLLTGLIYGFMLYKSDLSLKRIIAAWLINTAVVETFLAAYWLYVLYLRSSPYYTYLLARLISQAIKAVPEIAIIFGAGRLVKILERQLFKR